MNPINVIRLPRKTNHIAQISIRQYLKQAVFLLLSLDSPLPTSPPVSHILLRSTLLVYMDPTRLEPFVRFTTLRAVPTSLLASFAACPATSLAATEISPMALWHSSSIVSLVGGFGSCAYRRL